MSKLNDNIHQIDLTDRYRIFYPDIKEYAFYSTVYGIFSKIDHILEHKINLN